VRLATHPTTSALDTAPRESVERLASALRTQVRQPRVWVRATAGVGRCALCIRTSELRRQRDALVQLCARSRNSVAAQTANATFQCPSRRHAYGAAWLSSAALFRRVDFHFDTPVVQLEMASHDMFATAERALKVWVPPPPTEPSGSV
jgi:hypothetical protein